MPEKHGPHGVLLFFLLQKKRAIVPNSEAFNSFIGNGYQVPELKGESESSDGHQAGNVKNEALHVIGLHCMDLATKSSSSCRTGSWQRWHSVVTRHWTSCARKCTKCKGDMAVWVLSGPVGIFPFNCCCCVYTLCLLGMNVGFQMCLGVGNSRRAAGGLRP